MQYCNSKILILHNTPYSTYGTMSLCGVAHQSGLRELIIFCSELNGIESLFSRIVTGVEAVEMEGR